MPYLQVSELHKIYYEDWGNPSKPCCLYLHGGPGAGVREKDKRFFNPDKHRVIFFDQRGCSKSTPFGELKDNSTSELISDIEKLRTTLGIKTWYVAGASWGTFLALYYAIHYPEIVKGLILSGIFLGQKREMEWLYFPGGASAIYPDEYEKFLSVLDKNERDHPLKGYWKRLNESDEKEHLYLSWSRWEMLNASFRIDFEELNSLELNPVEKNIVKFEIYYFLKNCFLEYDDLILKNVSKLRAKPVILIQGRRDLVCPSQAAWELHKALPQSELIFLPDAAHGGSEIGVEEAFTQSIRKTVI